MSNEQNESDAKAHPVDTLVMLACPFCGTQPELSEYNCGNSSSVYAEITCSNCLLEMKASECCFVMNRKGEPNLHKLKVIKIWNTRAI
jgi:hypothetical protein